MISGLRIAAHSRSSFLVRAAAAAAGRSSAPNACHYPPTRLIGGSTSSTVSRHSLQTDDTHLLQQYRCFSSSSSEDKNAEEDKNEESDGTDEKEEETLEGGDAKEENKEETLQAEVKTLKDQLLRSLAEQENIRQIARKDVESSRNFAIKSFAKSLLEVSDNLQRALESVDEGELSSNQALSNFYEGINMTNDGLVKAFQSNGVEIYCEQPGEVFDPEMMNALMEYPDPSMEPGTVGQVIKVGFTLNKRVLRPAEVGVVKKA